MNSTNIHEGGCLCGAIRYRIEGRPKHVGHCHCRSCRRASGAVALTWAYVARDRFHLIQGTPTIYRSSENAERQFCRICGSALFYASFKEPDMIDIALGTLDDPNALPADHHNFIGEKIAWLHLDEELPAHEGFTPGHEG